MRRLVTFGELRDMGVLYTRQHLANLEIAGKFPKRVKLGPGRVAWVEREVREWIESRLNERHKKN